MNAVVEKSRYAQRAACMLMSTVIVAACLSLGAYGMQAQLHEGYSVTVTQLQ